MKYSLNIISIINNLLIIIFFIQYFRMYFLIIDTSSLKGILSIFKDDKIIFNQELSFGVRESNELVPVIEMAFKQTNIFLSDIDIIVLGKGPGSFTGLRIGASVAKAFSFVKSIPIVTVESLKCFAPEQEGPFTVLLDAKAKGIYLQQGLKEGDHVYFEDQFKSFKMEEVALQLQNRPNLISAHKESLRLKLPQEIFDKIIQMSPSPHQMLKMALKRSKTTLFHARDLLDLEYFSDPK